MSHKRIFALLSCIILSFILLSSCTRETATETQMTNDKQNTNSTVITDMVGRKLTLHTPITRIVALNPSDCEILYAIGAEDTLVGRGTYCDYPAAVLELPVVSSGQNLNIEEVIALQPQAVFMTRMDHSPEQIAALEAAGIQVIVSEASNIEAVYQSITLIGTVTNKQQAASNVINSMQQAFREIAAKAGGNSGKTIYFEISPLEYGLWTAGKNTFMDEIATMLGLTNAFADIDGWAEISEEQVLERNPDYIVTVTMYFGEGTHPVDEIMQRNGWQHVTAIENGTVFHADNDEFARPSPRLVNAANMLYQFIYETPHTPIA